jgi:hypothetical protein
MRGNVLIDVAVQVASGLGFGYQSDIRSRNLSLWEQITGTNRSQLADDAVRCAQNRQPAQVRGEPLRGPAAHRFGSSFQNWELTLAEQLLIDARPRGAPQR